MPTVDSIRATTPSHRAQLLAEAVVSAYIDEIARPRRRAVAARRRGSTTRTLTRKRRAPAAVGLDA
jgi:hypothetical protein